MHKYTNCFTPLVHAHTEQENLVETNCSTAVHVYTSSPSGYRQEPKNLCYEWQGVFSSGCHSTYPSPSQVPTTNTVERFWLQEPQGIRLRLGDHSTSYLEIQGKKDDA